MRDDTPRPHDRADPHRVATPGDFGRELTLARHRAGLTVRAVARATGLPVSTIGDYFSGRHLPLQTQPGALEEILRACGVTDPGLLREWDRALTRARKRPGRRSPKARPPYQGLARFEPQDAPWFFGREDITGQLAGLVAAAPAAGGAAQGLPLIVTGPPGSGKSSLLRAGLIARLTGTSTAVGPDQTGPRPVVLFTPGAHPLTELDIVEATGPAAGLLIVVDQFEEVFTECRDEQERRSFIAAICSLANRFPVVLALRSGLPDHALRYPGLATALGRRQVTVPPMTQDQVRRAICEPARLAGLDVEDVLAELIVRDLVPGPAAGQPQAAAHEPGALPRLSHALLVSWQHHRGGRLTVADYLASGGIGQAIARTAQTLYTSLDGDQQELARQTFLRLAQAGDGGLVTSIPVPLTDLTGPASAVLARFAAARLVSIGPATARITHDALLTEWPELRSWIGAARPDRQQPRRLSSRHLRRLLPVPIRRAS